MAVDSWNLQTLTWLKFVCYERLAKFKTLGVFALSFIWHGIEARFAMCFAIAALGLYAGRIVLVVFILFFDVYTSSQIVFQQIRRNIRPVFQKNKISMILYDIITCLCTVIYAAFYGSNFYLPNMQTCLMLNK